MKNNFVEYEVGNLKTGVFEGDFTFYDNDGALLFTIDLSKDNTFMSEAYKYLRTDNASVNVHKSRLSTYKGKYGLASEMLIDYTVENSEVYIKQIHQYIEAHFLNNPAYDKSIIIGINDSKIQNYRILVFIPFGSSDLTDRAKEIGEEIDKKVKEGKDLVSIADIEKVSNEILARIDSIKERNNEILARIGSVKEMV